ncbi:unnamed protein product [Gongylonema pulchrum]|uniref:Pyr_redox_2 domain-containing protein n=1 Tax=Gongylonema pulchrum TaxID=637853 RepID=A0A3P7RQM9_9BILA|nr:unnamed protein product [Gongylonema pulchrum]
MPVVDEASNEVKQKVTLFRTIFREKGNVAEILPEFLSKHASKELRKSGVNVMAEKEIKRITMGENGKLRLQLVTGELRARSDVWVAGDASSFYDIKLGRRRVEHWEHAQITGRLAGENMTGGQSF